MLLLNWMRLGIRMKFVTSLKWFFAASISLAALLYVADTLGLIKPEATILGDLSGSVGSSEQDNDDWPADKSAARNEGSSADNPVTLVSAPQRASSPTDGEVLRYEIGNLSDRLNESFPAMWSRPNENGFLQAKSLGRGCDAHLVKIDESIWSDGKLMRQEHTATFNFAEIVTISPVMILEGEKKAFDVAIQIAPEPSGAARVTVIDNQQSPYDRQDSINILQPSRKRIDAVRDLMLELRRNCRTLQAQQGS